MDVHSPKQRSFNMSRIKGKDTKPELKVRRWLWSNGYRYRLHVKDLPGKPDVVLKAKKSIIFIHGCFWHRHNCKYANLPKTRVDFWAKKLNANAERDKRNVELLQKNGWQILILWECEIKNWDTKAKPELKKFLDNISAY